jgi:hypothetical protein
MKNNIVVIYQTYKIFSLRENSLLSWVKIFVVPFPSGARQRDTLPYILCRTHDKEKTHGKKLFVVSFLRTHNKPAFFIAHGGA